MGRKTLKERDGVTQRIQPEMKLSVCMITYNHDSYLAQAIESVLMQKTNFDFELVIGEDCSADRTREIVFDYQKKHPEVIRLVTSGQNVGAIKNQYRTEKACRGKYVAYCEGDDYWHCPNKLQKQVDYMESHPECALVYSDCDYYYVATAQRISCINRYRKAPQPNNPSICAILFDPALRIPTCTVCLRRDFLNKVIDSDPILYQSGTFLMGDTPRWAEISLFGRIAYIDESLATHGVLIESAAHSRDVRKTLRFAKSGCELLLYLIDKHGLPASERSKYQECWCKSSLKLAFYERNAELANEVRKVRNGFTLAEQLRFWGSTSKFLNFVLLPAVCLYRCIRRLLCPAVDPSIT
jgi:glycosyltransferase involved in cell wall biosynthesis